MKEYILTPFKDPHGQPMRLFKALVENNNSKAIDQLSGICSGILADGVVNDAEALYFANWVRAHAPLQPVWPLTDILARIERIFADGHCDEEERQELKAIMEAICGQEDVSNPAETFSTKLPFDVPQPDPLVFSDMLFCITGRFAYGTRRKVMEAICARGGRASDAAPTNETNFLVIGTFASRDWISSNHGRKIEKAVEIRNSGRKISILSEEHWQKFIR